MDMLDPQRLPPAVSEGRERAPPLSGDIFTLRIKSALGKALRECPEPAEIIAQKISDRTGRPLSAAMLYAYTASSKPHHDIGLSRLAAFVEVTGAFWIYDLLLNPWGLQVMDARKAKLARLGEVTLDAEQCAIERDGLIADLLMKADPKAGRSRRAIAPE